jgi:4-hydroxy-3-polyprenylbenzoate decarboxylase
MAYYADFRAYLAQLESEGRLRCISRPIDKDRELHPLVRWQYRGIDEADRFGFLFEHLVDQHGQPCEGRVACSVIAANREMYARALGCDLTAVHARWDQAFRQPIAPTRVSTGPVKGVVRTGQALADWGGLQRLPIPITTNGWEPFPRITAAGFFTRDPDSGVTNVGMYNSIVLGPLRANARTSRHLHLHWEKYRQRGEPLPAAIVIGAVPVLSLVSSADVPYDTSELDVAGGLIGEPIALVRCETVDLEVPATAEVVIEGEIPTDLLDRDGPSGENRGHVMMGGMVHAFRVTAITHRQNPIWHDLVEGFPPTESSLMRSVNCEGRIASLLRTHGIPYVKDVAFHHCGSARHLCTLSFQELGGQRPPNTAIWHALNTVMAADPTWPKVVIAVDDDIDPHDLESVFFAIIDRCQPHRDVKILQGRGAGLDESVAPHSLELVVVF